jgi:hypothetical protein
VILLLALIADMNMNDVQIIAEKILNLTNSRIELYLAEGSMLKAPAAPRALVNIVHCSMSWTTVDAGRSLQCNPSNVHQEVDETTRGKRRRRRQSLGRTEQSRRRSPKTRSPHTQAGVADVDGGSGGLLSQLSVRAENWDGNGREQHNSSMTMFWLCVLFSLANKRKNVPFMQLRRKTKMKSQAHEKTMSIMAESTDKSIVCY